MAKVSVFIEEHLCREITVDIPNESDVSSRMDAAERLVRKGLESGDVVLTADDFNGQRLIMVQDKETGRETGWNRY